MAEVIRQVLGPHVTFRLESGAAPTGSSAVVEPAIKPAQALETPANRARRSRDELAQLPLVKKAMDVLGAKVLHQDEGFAVSAPPPPAPPEELAVPAAEDEEAQE